MSPETAQILVDGVSNIAGLAVLALFFYFILGRRD